MISFKKSLLSIIRAIPLSEMPLQYSYRKYQYWKLKGKNIEDVFGEIYREKSWGDSGSLSGEGSTLKETEVIRRMFPALCKDLAVTSVLDIPCGDFAWMRYVKLDGISYVGADIVPEIIRANAASYQTDKIRFCTLNLLSDRLPGADLILVRDCLVHLSNADVFAALDNIVSSSSQYLMSTLFTARRSNADIATGQWRPLNLLRPPFSLPTPMEVVNEQHPNPLWNDKSLGVWKIEDVRQSLHGRKRAS